MKLKTTILLICLFTSQSLFAAISNEKRDAIEKLMQLTGAAEMGKLFAGAFVEQMSTMLKKNNPDTPARAFTILEEEVNKLVAEKIEGENGLMAQMYPVYDKYFTLDDLKAMISFYQTPVGKKAIRVMPQLTRESMQIGQAWGMELGPVLQQRIIKRFEEEGIK